MAVIKVACHECGQKVSGDETYYGRSVDCPICSSKISFPVSANQAESAPTNLANEAVPSARSGAPTIAAAFPPEEAPLVQTNKTAGLPTPPKFDSKETESQTEADEIKTSAPNPAALLDEEESSDHETLPSPIFGIASLALGILNTLTACLLGLILAPITVVLGHIALAKAKASPVQPAPGKTMGLIGLILGYLGLLGVIVLLIGLLVMKKPIKEAIEEQKAREAIEEVVREIEQP